MSMGGDMPPGGMGMGGMGDIIGDPKPMAAMAKTIATRRFEAKVVSLIAVLVEEAAAPETEAEPVRKRARK